MRRLQLRQWLVLLLRTLIVALIVCAFARPTYQAGGGWGGGDRPVAVHALLDLSYSTRYHRPSGSLFDQLQHQLGDLLAVLPPRDQVAVQPFAQRPHAPFAGDRNYLSERIAELAPTQEATDLRAALHTAAQRFDQESALAAHELFLFTDLAEHNWDQLDASVPSFAGTRIYVAGPRAQPRPNAYVKRVAAPSWMLAADAKVTLQTEIAHSGEGTTLDLFVDGQRVPPSGRGAWSTRYDPGRAQLFAATARTAEWAHCARRRRARARQPPLLHARPAHRHYRAAGGGSGPKMRTMCAGHSGQRPFPIQS